MDPRLERFRGIAEEKKQQRAAAAGPSRQSRILSVHLEKVTGHEAWDLYLAEIERMRQTAEKEASDLRTQILNRVRDPVETANLHIRLHGVVGISSGLTMAIDTIYTLIAQGKSDERSDS